MKMVYLSSGGIKNALNRIFNGQVLMFYKGRMVSTQIIIESGPIGFRPRSVDIGYSESGPIRSSCEISPPVSIDKAAKNSLISSSSTFLSSNFNFFEISTGVSQSFRRLNFNIPWFAGAFHTKSSFDII